MARSWVKPILILLIYPASGAFAQARCSIGTQMGSTQFISDTPEMKPQNAPSQITGEWIRTWGAIASSDNGDIGSSTGKFSEEDAKVEAIKICTNFGNSDCEVNFTYKNQCVAVVQAAKGRTGQVSVQNFISKMY
ncbi:DUF4189 domain-containing protein [Xanthomonas sp. CFBP 8151]|uniref:DUF4189 domain-containing protein n=1 Tax=Xanthomonas sp. CFBP 8151 TaxID=3035310 RepID=UPI00141A7BB0|nr:DUF4189 domain-containing protein [Xanthomonas sp. CFBP 8151]